jgi:hypothetical protein
MLTEWKLTDSGLLPFLYTSSSNVDISNTGTLKRKLHSRNRRESTTQREEQEWNKLLFFCANSQYNKLRESNNLRDNVHKKLDISSWLIGGISVEIVP